MDIRQADKADFDTILAIYNQSIFTYHVTSDLEYVTKDDRQAWFEFHLNNAKYPLWVVLEHKKVIGWFSLSPFSERAGYLHTAEISIYLDLQAKGRGYGSKILQFMQENMCCYGINTLLAYVFEENHPSCHLMKKHGFECWGRFPSIANLGIDEQGKERLRTLLILGYQKGFNG